MSRDLVKTCDQKVILLYGWYPLKVSYHFDKFDEHRYCGSRGMMDLDCHMTLQHPLTKWLSNGQEPLKLNHHPAKYSGHRHSGSRGIMVLVVHDQTFTYAITVYL